MIEDKKNLFLWDHSPIGDIFSVSLYRPSQLAISIRTQVLKLASRFANQNSKEEVMCLLVGSCENKSGKINIDIDRIECNLASYLCDNQLLSSSDICIPLKIFKNKSSVDYNEEEYIPSFKEYLKYFEDVTLPIVLSKVMFLKAYAGLNNDKFKTKSHLSTVSWIDFKLFIPDLHLTLSPLNKVPIFRSALVSSFENQAFSSELDNGFTFGYLSIDQLGKVHFLLHSDERAMTAALVGIWVHGVSDVSDILVLASCMKYILINSTKTKMSKPPFPFLLAQFTNQGKDTLRFFDIKWPKGPSQDGKLTIKHLDFKVFSSVDNLDQYYQAPNEKATTFDVILAQANPNNKANEVFFKAYETFISQNYENNTKDDTVPRYISNRSNVQSMMTEPFQSLEVSDVSLLVNDVSIESNTTFKSQPNYDAYITNLVSSVCPSEPKEISKPKCEVIPSLNNKIDEANPRPVLRKQLLNSSVIQQVPRNDLYNQQCNQVQFIPQPIFTYPMYPSNPYVMFHPNMLVQGQERNLPVVSKPPPRPKQIHPATKIIKDSTSKINGNKISNITPREKSIGVNIAAITDVTNTSAKRVLQLDREEDLATLELLVQQIINQRNQTKPLMVSRGVNTTETFNLRSSKLVETSTDIPSFISHSLCSRCHRVLNGDGDEIEILNQETNLLNENDDKENSLILQGPESCHKSAEASNILIHENHEKQVFQEECEESMHYSELLNNLEEFVKQSRNNFEEKETKKDCNQPPNDEEVSKLYILEEAVQNLRELDITQDMESKYWQTMRNTLTVETEDEGKNTNNGEFCDSLDTTILQQKINYVSIFLNNSVLSPVSCESQLSMNEQSVFIDSLARKYLHKATSELERNGRYSSSSKYTHSRPSYKGRVDCEQSISTRDYLQKYHLNDNDNQSDTYYSSIRMVDGNALPTNKWAISSTPASHFNEISVGCKKNQIFNNNSDSWSGVRILEGLKQQPSILPPTNSKSSNIWPNRDYCNSAAASEMLLDLDKLRQLPKYL